MIPFCVEKSGGSQDRVTLFGLSEKLVKFTGVPDGTAKKLHNKDCTKVLHVKTLPSWSVPTVNGEEEGPGAMVYAATSTEYV